MMVFAYALYVPTGIALTSAYASQLLASMVRVTIDGWALFVVILAAVARNARRGTAQHPRPHPAAQPTGLSHQPVLVAVCAVE